MGAILSQIVLSALEHVQKCGDVWGPDKIFALRSGYATTSFDFDGILWIFLNLSGSMAELVTVSIFLEYSAATSSAMEPERFGKIQNIQWKSKDVVAYPERSENILSGIHRHRRISVHAQAQMVRFGSIWHPRGGNLCSNLHHLIPDRVSHITT